jgi:hypothetical protein
MCLIPLKECGAILYIEKTENDPYIFLDVTETPEQVKSILIQCS